MNTGASEQTQRCRHKHNTYKDAQGACPWVSAASIDARADTEHANTRTLQQNIHTHTHAHTRTQYTQYTQHIYTQHTQHTQHTHNTHTHNVDTPQNTHATPAPCDDGGPWPRGGRILPRGALERRRSMRERRRDGRQHSPYHPSAVHHAQGRSISHGVALILKKRFVGHPHA